MNAENEIEVLLVEDNPDDAELTIRELKKRHLANKLVHRENGSDLGRSPVRATDPSQAAGIIPAVFGVKTYCNLATRLLIFATLVCESGRTTYPRIGQL